MNTYWLTTIGEVVNCPSPVKVQFTVLVLSATALRVPPCRKYPV